MTARPNADVTSDPLQRLAREAIPTRPTPYIPPHRQPITPEQAEANRRRLAEALTQRPDRPRTATSPSRRTAARP